MTQKDLRDRTGLPEPDRYMKMQIELDGMAALVCGKLCRYPHMIDDQDVLDAVCNECRMNDYVSRLTDYFGECRKEVTEHAGEDNDAGGTSDGVSEFC